MAVGVGDLVALVNCGLDDDLVLQQCLAFGVAVVGKHTSRVAVGVIPQVILDEAILTAAADQFQRRKAPNGVLNVYDAGDGSPVPVRVGRDPLAAIRPLLAPWVTARTSLRSVPLSNGWANDV